MYSYFLIDQRDIKKESRLLMMRGKDLSLPIFCFSSSFSNFDSYYFSFFIWCFI